MANDSAASTPRVMTTACMSCSLADMCGVDQTALIFPIEDIEDMASCPLLNSPKIPAEPEIKGYLQPESEIEPVNLGDVPCSLGSGSPLAMLEPNLTGLSSGTMERSLRPAAQVLGESRWHEHHRSFSSGEDVSDEPMQPKRDGEKEVHRLTEKRYRTNINEKLQSLRDVLPSYRSCLGQAGHAFPRTSDITTTRSVQKSGGIHRQRHLKQNKGAILSEAVIYINYLERKIEELTEKKYEINRYDETGAYRAGDPD